MLGIIVLTEKPLSTLLPLILSGKHSIPGGGESTPTPVPPVDMFVPQEALNQVQLNSAMCWYRSERKRRRLIIADTEEQMGRLFSAYGSPLIAVPSFKYLGRIF